MFNSIPEFTRNSPGEQTPPLSIRTLSLGCVDIPDQTVTSAVDAIISRIAPAYLDLMRKAKENPDIISDYKSSLNDHYKNMSLTPEIRADLKEAKNMASNCNVIFKKLPSRGEISVFSENNREFLEGSALAKARFFVKLRIKSKDVQEEDPLDCMLSQLSKKILSLGYGDKGIFDVRLEKGCMSLAGNPWRWHCDGEIFKTSITVCYSNKKNWSTRVVGEKDEIAAHGFFYDALKVYHRAPIPSDLNGEELNADDYRLFIRYNEYRGKREVSPEIDLRDKKETEKIFDNQYNFKDEFLARFPNVDLLLQKEKKKIVPLDISTSFLKSKPTKFLLNEKQTSTLFQQGLLDVKWLETDSNGSSSILQDLLDGSIDPLIKDNVQPLTSEIEKVELQEKSKPSQCIVM